MDDFEFVKLGGTPQPQTRVSTTFTLPGTEYQITVASPEGQLLLMLYQELVAIRKALAAVGKSGP